MPRGVIEMLLYGFVTWALGMEHFTVLHSARRKLLVVEAAGQGYSLDIQCIFCAWAALST